MFFWSCANEKKVKKIFSKVLHLLKKRVCLHHENTPATRLYCAMLQYIYLFSFQNQNQKKNEHTNKTNYLIHSGLQ